MVSQQDLDTQVDFSGGQINLDARRRGDSPIFRAGARVARNWRATSSGQLKYRPGRRAAYITDARRGDFLRASDGSEFTLRFSAGKIAVLDANGIQVAQSSSASYIWGDADVSKINWAQAQDMIFVCYPGMRPQIVSYEHNTGAWSFSQFAFDTTSGVVYQPYYRGHALGAKISYSATTGSVILTCDADYFRPNMIGLTLSILGQQVKITSVTDGQHATATPTYRLPDTIKVQVIDTNPFQVGQIVSAVTQNIKFEVGYIDTVGKWVHGVLLSNLTFQAGQFDANDTLVSPFGSSKFGAGAPDAGDANLPTLQWQEEFMNAVQGWPGSVSFDRGRVIFCDFPQAKNAVLWSAVAAPQTFWIDSVAAGAQPAAGANATAAMLYLVTGAPHVRFVIGWQQGQFAFSDIGTYFTPISNVAPLVPGSVEFDKISDDGVAQIRPVTIQDAIVFINAGLTRCAAVRATGTTTRPMLVEDISDAHTDLFVRPVQLAIATGDGELPERYVYVVNQDGSVVVGKIVSAVGSAQMFVGWAPWTCAGAVRWVNAVGPRVQYTTEYFSAEGAQSYIVENEDSSLFLDYCVTINALPASLARPPGKGPFWKLPGASVTVMDGARDLGERTVDDDGFVIASPDEDLTAASIVAGFFTQAEFQPFVEPNNRVDRTRKMKIAHAIINVRNATDFQFGSYIFPVQRFGDDEAAQPIFMDGAFRARQLGRSNDPTIALVKHRPGPLTLCEFSAKVSN
jgi:hypothetical protein